jgi:hypothetical protein
MAYLGIRGLNAPAPLTFKGKEREQMDRMKEDRSRSKNVTSGTPNRGRANPYTHTKMPLEREETREREDVEDIEE